MMKIVTLRNIDNFIIVMLLVLLISCDSNNKENSIKIMELKVSNNLNRLIKSDLICYKNKYLDKSKKKLIFSLNVEQKDSCYYMHFSPSSGLFNDVDYSGFFYSGDVLCLVYGKLIDDIFTKKEFKNFEVNKSKKSSKQFEDDQPNWHYVLINNQISYFIKTTDCN